ncbi:MAG: hypothetical protein ACAI34_03020 [Verrucomicrobium sp.]|nr:hypothetical protein [Verrucomicrobium sp.]
MDSSQPLFPGFHHRLPLVRSVAALLLVGLSATVFAVAPVKEAPLNLPAQAGVESSGGRLNAPASTLSANPTSSALSHLPGVGLAEGVSQITGTAVSPLLGVSAIGAWKYFTTEEGLRSRLPWYCHPWVWGSCFVVLGMCFLKDFLGAAAPPLVKKPLDFVELFEDKASALVASTAFVPLIATAMAQMNAVPLEPEGAATATISAAQLGLATVMPVLGSVDVSWLKTALYIPVAFIGFAIVWLSSHAINVLIALSPFGIVDAGLKLIKLGVLGLITASAFISPALALVVCVLILIPACFIAGPTFRLMVFGNVFGLDLLLRRKAAAGDLDETKGIKAFNAGKVCGAPTRTYGRLTKDRDGRAVFRYRPWLILPSREAAVETQPNGLAQGLLYPSLTRDDHQTGRPRTSFVLLPRYRDFSEAISARFGITKVMDSTLLRGFKAMRNWLVEALSFGKSGAGATAGAATAVR